MAAAPASERAGRSIGEVLGAGWRLFLAGMSDVFPWVFAAELVQLVPLTTPATDILNTDITSSFQLNYLWGQLLLGFIQAFFYGIAVLRLARLAGEKAPGSSAWNALRSVPAIFIGYMIYSLLVLLGVGFGLIVFLNMLALGVVPAVVFTLVPLVPTAIVSTALALFIYPAVLERRGPFASLQESAHLAKSSWVRVTAVVSVPALVMMCEWAVNNGVDIWKIISAAYGALLQAQDEGLSLEDIEKLVGSATSTASAPHGYLWRVAAIGLAALSWWYALAVCYAQYRDLKTQSMEMPKKQAH